MADHLFGIVELTLVFGGAIAWGLWELRSTARARRETERALDAARQARNEGTMPRE